MGDDATRLDRLTERRELLEALLRATDDPSKAAAASRELRALDDLIEQSGEGKQGSAVDELKRRRTQRRSTA